MAATISVATPSAETARTTLAAWYRISADRDALLAPDHHMSAA